MSHAQEQLLKAVTAAQRVTQAAQDLAAEVQLEPPLDEEEETAEEEEELTEGEEARRPNAQGSEERSNPGHLQPPSKLYEKGVSRHSE